MARVAQIVYIALGKRLSARQKDEIPVWVLFYLWLNASQFTTNNFLYANILLLPKIRKGGSIELKPTFQLLDLGNLISTSVRLGCPCRVEPYETKNSKCIV